MIKKLLGVLLILGLTLNTAFGADKWMEGTGASPVAGSDSVSDLDTLIDASIVNPLDRLLTDMVRGCTLTWTDANTITVGIGQITCSDGSVQRMRENTSTFTIDLSTSSDTSGVDKVGDVDKASSMFHIYANADADATTFTGTASLSASAPDGPTYYKYIGSVYNDSGQDMLAWFWSGGGNDVRYMWDIPRNATTTLSDNTWSAALDCSSFIPFSSTLGIFGLSANDSGVAKAGLWIRPAGSAWYTGAFNETGAAFGIWDQHSDAAASGQRQCATDSSQQINYANNAGDSSITINVEGFIFSR